MDTIVLCECGCGNPAAIAKQTDRKHGAVAGQPRRFALGHNSRTKKNDRHGVGDSICECGCGQATELALVSNAKYGWVAGEPVKFRPGHNFRQLTPEQLGARRQNKIGKGAGAINGNWGGGRITSSNGYTKLRVGKAHHLADASGYAYEHRVVMEEKLGRRLEPQEDVHHVDEVKSNNDPSNLMLFADRASHMRHHGGHREKRRG